MDGFMDILTSVALWGTSIVYLWVMINFVSKGKTTQSKLFRVAGMFAGGFIVIPLLGVIASVAVCLLLVIAIVAIFISIVN